jgi:hypothetical protein
MAPISVIDLSSAASSSLERLTANRLGGGLSRTLHHLLALGAAARFLSALHAVLRH